MEGKHIRFYQLLEQQLNKILSTKFAHRLIDRNLLREVHATIRETIDGVFGKSTHTLAPESASWLTDQYFKAIKLNETNEVKDIVVMNEYKLEELPYHDIKLLRNLFLETTMGPALDAELRRRNMS